MKISKLSLGFWTVMITMFVINFDAFASNPDCSSFSTKCVAHQFDLGVSGDDVGKWAPRKGAVLFYGGINLFQAILYFDQNAITFYENNGWAGLDIDIIFPDNSWGDIKKIDASSVKGPTGTDPLRDTIVTCSLSEQPTRGITVTKPRNLRVGWNHFSFRLNDDIPGQTRIKVNVQLVANVTHEQFKINFYEQNSDILWVYNQYNQWVSVSDAGLLFSLGGEVFKYFSMADFMQAPDPGHPDSNQRSLIISPNSSGNGLCWDDPDPADNAYAILCNSVDWFTKVNGTSTPSDESVQESVEDDAGTVSEEEIEELVQMYGSDPDDPTIYTPDQDSDLHIKDFYLAIYGTDHWEHRVEMQLYPGQSFQIEGKARIENDSGVDADDIDSDYRVDHGKNFDDQDTKLDEDNPFDLDPYEVVTKKMGRTTISLSQDGQTVTVQGPGRSESFDVEDGFCKIYIFVDVENDDDKDISSNTDSDEYGVVEVTVSGVSPDNSGYIPSPVSFSAQQAAALISIISN